MRLFQLINEKGATFDLASKKNPFLYKPKGLGTAFTATYGDTSDGFFNKTVYKGSQAAVTGTLVFTSSPYTRFREFLAFCESAEELKFGYRPTTTWYYSACVLSKLEKGELEKTGVLEASVEFKLLSPWAKENPVKKKIEPSADALTYPMAYPFTYGGDIAGSVEFTINGDMDGAYEISIPGALENPVIKLEYYDGSYTTIGAAAITGTIAEGETLELSTRPDNSYIRKVSGSTVTDLTDSVDIEMDVFARPQRGKCRLTVTSDTSESINAEINIYDYYRAV